MEADLSGSSERVERIGTLPNDSVCDSDTKCDSQFPGATQINAEMEEGELPSEDCSKPSTPIKYSSALNADCGSSQSSKLKLEMGSYARKPVLGKEKAKQRLKALRIQNKLQMESRNNTTPKKQTIKHTSDPSHSGSSSSATKKDRKLLSPLEQAQLTVNEIEVMKLEGERPKVPICYHESMIHRITADSLDSSNVSQPTLTSSIEALKAYNDDHFCGEERKRKRAKPEAYRRRRKSAVFPSSPPVSSSRRRLKFRREKVGGRGSSRDRVKSGSKISKKERRRSRERPVSSAVAAEKSVSRPCSFAIRPGGLVPSIWEQGEHLRFTQTRPVISYRVKQFKPTKSKVKLRKRSRKKREAKPAVVAGNLEDGAPAKPKRKKKSKSKSKSRDRLSSEKKPKKKKSKKSGHPKRQIGGLSFVVDELNFEEELDAFPLSKEGFQPSVDSDDGKPQKQDKFMGNLGDEEASTPIGKGGIGTPVPDGSDLTSTVPNIHESTPEDRSPDTDDYMPNWEEEDEDSEKDETILPFFVKDQLEPTNEDAYSSTEESTPESIKDGLGTPIFVNPSPPREMLEQISFPENDSEKQVAPHHDPKEHKDSEEEEESHTPPPMKPKHLFEMENIYEEFLRSVREDPDFKESLPNEPTSTASTTDEDESGFLSQTSVSLTPPAIPALPNSSPNSSDESSKTDESSDTESSESQSLSSTNEVGFEDTKKTVKGRCETIGEAAVEFETMLNEAELANISPEDLKKLRSLQKRRGMLKWIRQQIDGMDEEDRLCLLGLEKLMRAERQLLLRNSAIRKLHELKNILGSDSEDSKDGVDNKTDRLESTASAEALQGELSDNGAILDGKRETIKLTITSQFPMKATSSLHGTETYKETCDEDQDFTERLMKPKEKFAESPSRSKNTSPQRSAKQKSRSGRSLSVSPMRRSRKSKGQERTSERSKRRAYSPSPSRTTSRRRDGKTSSRNRNSGSPPASNRSRRSCRSPYTPEASPTRSPSSSRSPSHSPLAIKEDMTDQGLVNSYPAWNIDRYSQYYVGDSYYFPNAPSDKSGGEQPRYPVAYDYAHYNMYASEYMNVGTNYQAEYGQQSDYSGHNRENDDCNPYLSIPVIGSSSVGSPASYFYKESGFEESHTPIMPVATNVKCIEIHRQEASNSPKPFAVQKGNVLEIVPATTITAVVKEASVVKKELLDIVIKKEPVDDEPSLPSIDDDEKIECTVDIKVETKVSKKNHSWKDEVARRHVVSAVMRLNKETEDSPRGILKSRGNSTIPVRDKKKVLFADGIPPGRSSSASSDEEATLKFIKKRLKKTQRRMQSENKENETAVEAAERNQCMHEAKADPELWDAPPPPPPPGSPPPHLLQPILIRPASPEELLYFHYDPVYSMMYVSPMENAIPPRLLQNNGKPTAKPNVETSPAENEETTAESSATGKSTPSPPSPTEEDDYNSPDRKEELTDGVSPSSIVEKKCTNSPEETDSPTPPQQAPTDPQCASPSQAPLPPAQQSSSPPQKIQNIVSIRVSNSPLLYNQGSVPNVVPTSPAYEPTHPPLPNSPKQLHQSPTSRTPISMMVGYPGQIFNRMPNRRMSPNVVRSPYNMPPPSPYSRAFNPHIPPPFHQPPPCTNHMSPHSASYESSLPPMPSSSAPQPPAPFNTNMMMFGNPLSHQHTPPTPGFSFNVSPSNPTPPQHMMMNRPPARFSSISSPVAVPKFLHGSDRNGSPHLGSLVYRHHPPIPQPPLPHQPPPSTPPPTTPYN